MKSVESMRCRRFLLVLAVALGFASCASAEPRNVILFVGDGMGVSTVTAARIFAGQQQGGPGEEHYLAFERLPHVALVKTYNVDAQVSDSAGTMTALVTGHKARAGVLSVAPEAPRGDCQAASEQELPTLLEEAEQRGMKTGVVSTARITHATPAAAYAHAADRNWEYDAVVPEEDRDTCSDIARQLVEFPYGDGVDVVLGGGRMMFRGQGSEPGARRQDGRDLAAEWRQARAGRHYVADAEALMALPDIGQVLGLFSMSHMEYEADRKPDGGEPSLAEMTRFAIDRLANDVGFFLVVEAGRIDHAHHQSNAYRALVDTVALSDAVAVALAATDSDETLIVVTADHSHTLTIAGYPRRGNPILGFVVESSGRAGTDSSGARYTTLGYANGPGAIVKRTASDQPEAPDYRQAATHPMLAETHAGEDVPAYALGPGAEGIGGVMDQHELHAVMRTALFGEQKGDGQNSEGEGGD